MSQPMPRIRLKPGAEHWRLDRRIPVPFLLGALTQLIMLAAWAAYLDARVSSIEKEMSFTRPLTEQFARLEERLDAIREDIRELKGRVEKHR